MKVQSIVMILNHLAILFFFLISFDDLYKNCTLIKFCQTKERVGRLMDEEVLKSIWSWWVKISVKIKFRISELKTFIFIREDIQRFTNNNHFLFYK